MKNLITILCLFTVLFSNDKGVDMDKEEPKVLGIGGIFFKSDNPEETKKWYKENLGIITDQYGSMFKSRNIDNPDEINYLQWSPFNKDTDYFDPSKKEFMINYKKTDWKTIKLIQGFGTINTKIFKLIN